MAWEKTSNTQHPTSNIQRRCRVVPSPLGFGCSMLSVGCSYSAALKCRGSEQQREAVAGFEVGITLFRSRLAIEHRGHQCGIASQRLLQGLAFDTCSTDAIVRERERKFPAPEQRPMPMRGACRITVRRRI